MKLTIPEFDINEDEPFLNDVLYRQAFGESLERLITDNEDSLVIALDAAWGEGKTTFVKMWQSQLTKNNFNAIYIDAFENDYVEDAFISIVSQIVAFIEGKKTNSALKKKAKGFKKTAAKAGTHLLGMGLKVGVKALTLNVIGEDEMKGIAKIGSEFLSDSTTVASKFVEDSITKHIESVETINSFKKSLKDIADLIKDETGKPLVIIIDELDRCKPTYAVEIIEKIKHLFSVDNTVFLLVMNREQLEESIKSIYGREIRADIYLQKFVHIFCHLPSSLIETVYGDNIDKYQLYSELLYEKHELKVKESGYLLPTLVSLARHFSLSLRELEKSFTYLAILYTTIPENSIRITELIAFLCMLKVKSPKLYKRLSNMQIEYNELEKELKLVPSFDFRLTRENPFTLEEKDDVILFLAYCLMEKTEYHSLLPDSVLSGFAGDLMRRRGFNRFSREGIIPFHCRFIDLFNLK